jgi:hypothetical protein
MKPNITRSFCSTLVYVVLRQSTLRSTTEEIHEENFKYCDMTPESRNSEVRKDDYCYVMVD